MAGSVQAPAGSVPAPITTVATVELEPVQLLAPDGTLTSEQRYSSALPPETAAWLYEMMVVTRDLDGEFINLQRQGELALYASCRGQEAAQVGAVAGLHKADWLFPQYRELGAFLLRGITPAQMGAVWRGSWHGGLDFTKKHCAPISIQIGTQPLHAVGAAMAAQRLGEQSVTVAFLGDGATSEGDVHEAMNFASVFAAPCVFYVQNNQWAISVPVATQSRSPLYRRGAGYGIPSIPIDGNDVLASYAVTRVALDAARAGDGPRAIEAMTYRMGAHTTSDDPTKYRTSDEEEAWARRDPIARMRAYLRGRGASDAFFKGIEAEAAKVADDARVRTVELGGIPTDLMFDHVYSEPHPLIDEQRAWLARYEASFEEGPS
jgi:2-oxoisovalerate dehydrogenase E1 component alpha subunit